MAWSVGAGLEGKGVMITGAAGGIGREVAKAFATTGARLMLVDLNRDASEGVLTSWSGGRGPSLGRCSFWRISPPCCVGETPLTRSPKRTGISS